MPHTSEEQLKSEPTIEQAVVPTPEVLSFPHDILGKEYELNGVSFTVLGMQPVYYANEDDKQDLQPDVITITDIQSQKTPVIPFQGGMACITKIRIGDEVVAGYKNILDEVHESCDLPRVDPVTGMYIDLEGTCWMPATPLGELFGFISRYKIQNLKLSSIVGIDRRGFKNTLYSVQEAREFFQGLIELPQVNRESGIYEDEHGKKYMSASRFNHDFGMTFHQINTQMKDVTPLKGVSNGREVILYPLDALLEAHSRYNSLSVVDKETNIYTDSKDGSMWAPLIYFTKKYSLFSDTVKNYFIRNNISSRHGREKSGKEVELYDIVCGEPVLQEIVTLPCANDDGYYRDSSETKWAPLSILRTLYDIDVSSIERLMGDVPMIRCRDRAKNQTTFYLVEQACKKIDAFVCKPHIDTATGIYDDGQGVQWAPIRYFRNKYGIGHSTFESYAGHVRTLDGRTQGARGAIKLYDIMDAEDALKHFFSLSLVDKTTGMVQDEHGVLWTTENGFCAAHQTSNGKFHTMLDGIPTREGRGANGMKCTLYQFEALNQKFEDFLSLPTVDKESGVYRDIAGMSWAGIVTIAKLKGVSASKIISLGVQVSSIRGRDKTGSEVRLYNIEELDSVLAHYSNLPHVNRITGVHTDSMGKKWMAHRPLALYLGIGETVLKSAGTISKMQGRDKIGKEVDLYNIEEAENVLRSFLQLPLVDEAGIFVDEAGVEWQQVEKAAIRFSISRQRIEGKNIEARIGRTKKNHKTKLYKVKDVEHSVMELNSATYLR